MPVKLLRLETVFKEFDALRVRVGAELQIHELIILTLQNSTCIVKLHAQLINSLVPLVDLFKQRGDPITHLLNQPDASISRKIPVGLLQQQVKISLA